MGLKKNYDELTGNPAFSDGLTVSTGQAIEDSSGVKRFGFESSVTEVQNNNGKPGISLNDGFVHRYYVPENTPLEFFDRKGVFTALKYQPTASAPGTLELTNSALDIDSAKTISGRGNVSLSISGDGTTGNSYGLIQESSNGFTELKNFGGEIRGRDESGNETILT